MVKNDPTSFRLSPEAAKLLETLSERLGVSKTAVIEMAVRKLGRQEVGTQQIEKES